jgi:hypothetical protein
MPCLALHKSYQGHTRLSKFVSFAIRGNLREAPPNCNMSDNGLSNQLFIVAYSVGIAWKERKSFERGKLRYRHN